MYALQINVLHKQEDTQAKEVTREVAGALLREASSRLAPQCPCAEISALPLSLLLSVRLALFTCCCLWKPASGSYLCLAGHMAFTGVHMASPHCGGIRDLLWFPIPGNPLQWQDMAPEAVWSTIAVLQCGTDQETAAWETGLGYNHQMHTTLALCSWTRVNKSRRFCKISKALGTNSSSKWDCRGHFALHSGQWGQYALASPSAS